MKYHLELPIITPSPAFEKLPSIIYIPPESGFLIELCSSLFPLLLSITIKMAGTKRTARILKIQNIAAL